MSARAQVQLECDHLALGRDVCRVLTAPLTNCTVDGAREYWRAHGWARGGVRFDGALGDLCPHHARAAAGR